MIQMLGLFDNPKDIEPVVEKLHSAGVSDKQVRILSDPSVICELIGCNPTNIIINYSIWGGIIGMGIYGLFGLAAALCQCNLMQFGTGYGVVTLLLSGLGGLFVGGFIGLLTGAGEADKKTHYYVQGLRLGGKVIAVQVEETAVEQMKKILVAGNGLEIKTLQGSSA